MTNNQLARKARRQLRRAFRSGDIDKRTYARSMEATYNDAVLTEWNARISSAQLNPWEHQGLLMQSLKGFDFSVIWDWFAENWDEILRILLALLPLFLGDEE
jgi:hypothetical protein